MSDETKAWAEIEGAQKELVYGLLLDQGAGVLQMAQRRGAQGMRGAAAQFGAQIDALKAALDALGYVRPDAPRIEVPRVTVPPVVGGRHGARRRN